jgi:hypothetical protein
LLRPTQPHKTRKNIVVSVGQQRSGYYVGPALGPAVKLSFMSRTWPVWLLLAEMLNRLAARRLQICLWQAVTHRTKSLDQPSTSSVPHLVGQPTSFLPNVDGLYSELTANVAMSCPDVLRSLMGEPWQIQGMLCLCQGQALGLFLGLLGLMS